MQPQRCRTLFASGCLVNGSILTYDLRQQFFLNFGNAKAVESGIELPF